MDLRKLKTLIDLVSESNVSELEITEADGKVRIVKGQPPQAAVPQAVYYMPQAGAPMPVPPGGMPAQPPQPSPAAAAPRPAEPSGKVVKSPMVGTFYRASNPETPPFVSVGDLVEKGSVICIIEAMKLMNEIESDFSGEIREVLVENGQPVEYGQPLFLID